MELTRKQVIEELQKMLDYCSIRQDSTPEIKQALVYAISSLKADEAYQLMYEGGEIYTKADLVVMFTDLKNKLIDKSWNIDMYDGDLDFECCYLTDIDEVIQQKIDKLKEVETE